MQMICIWPSWCHCHHIISCFSKIQNGLPFWCRLTQVVLEKKPLNVYDDDDDDDDKLLNYTIINTKKFDSSLSCIFVQSAVITMQWLSFCIMQ